MAERCPECYADVLNVDKPNGHKLGCSVISEEINAKAEWSMRHYRGRCGQMHKLIEGCPLCDMLNEKDEAMSYYCAKCDIDYEVDGKCKCVGIAANVPSEKLSYSTCIHGIPSSHHCNDCYWNEAIEAAARIVEDVEDGEAAIAIRGLKK